MDWFDSLEKTETAVAEKVEVLQPPQFEVQRKELTLASQRALQRQEAQASRIREIEDELLGESLSILQDSLRFKEIGPDSKEPPVAWVEELGPQKAMERFRVAMAAWMSAKEAPVALSIAKSLAVGIVKARATEKGGARTLNMTMVQMNMPQVNWEEIEVDS